MRLRQSDVDARERRRQSDSPGEVAPAAPTHAERIAADVGSERTIPPAVQDPPRAPIFAAAVRPEVPQRWTTDPALAERTIDGNDLVGEAYLELALLAAQPVCRVSVRRPDGTSVGYATGFLIAPHMLLTNWHVFHTADEARSSYVEFDYRQDVAGKEIAGSRFSLQPDRLFLEDQTLDYAVVAVSGVSDDRHTPLSRYGHHRLGANDGIERWMTIIQHPGGQPRQFAIRENQCTSPPEGVVDDRFVWYRSDTARGSSGAPVFDDSFRVVALHHFGRARQRDGMYLLRNGDRVASLDGLDDTEVDWESNEGVRAKAIAADLQRRIQADPELAASASGRELLASLGGSDDIITRARRGEITGRRPADADLGGPPPPSQPRSGEPQLHVQNMTVTHMFVGGAPTITTSGAPAIVPSREPTHPSRQPAAVDALAEARREPIIDRKYSNRRGYRPDFLGIEVPLPKVDRELVSKMDNGKFEIPYQHFSIVMNRHRRLAIYCASNVDFRPGAHPKGADYTRKTLGGFGAKDTEVWVPEGRIPAEHQLPNRFYDRDRQAFDRGHIVRREDVCFGRTRAVIQRANGDTYHVTNCSPQVKGFNQSKEGGIWGLLENDIARQGKAERYCLFAGPIFDVEDPEFDGYDDLGRVTIQIPQAFWKIVVARVGDDLAAYAFALEQDLSDVQFSEAEFDPTGGDWYASMQPLAELAERIGLEFAAPLLAADRYGAVEEGELARHRVRRPSTPRATRA